MCCVFTFGTERIQIQIWLSTQKKTLRSNVKVLVANGMCISAVCFSIAACLVPVRLKSSIRGPSLDGPHTNVEIGVTSDGRTIVCYHPTVDIPYELTRPIEQPNPLNSPVESHEQVLKAHLSKEVLNNKEGPTIEELSKMFFTTKHRWYPVGQ
uniref:Large ribosomal subunit protein mL42 n=1 Tax=Mola mola TaxID=94237 RepID=A0A3Q3VPP8_MOLML